MSQSPIVKGRTLDIEVSDQAVAPNARQLQGLANLIETMARCRLSLRRMRAGVRMRRTLSVAPTVDGVVFGKPTRPLLYATRWEAIKCVPGSARLC